MNPQCIPQELKNLPQWVCYKEHRGNPKVPFNPIAGTLASSTNPTTWGSFEEAYAAYTRGEYEGIGFVFSKNDPYAGIDLDKCINRQGQIEPWASDIMVNLNSYTELSPSGTGAHIIIKGQLPINIKGRKKANIEVYGSHRYFTITGAIFTGISANIEDRQQELTDFFYKHFGDVSQVVPTKKPDWWGQGPVDMSELPPQDQILLQQAQRNDKFQNLFDGGWEGHKSQSEADMALVGHLANWCGNDPKRIDRLFRASELYREKWDRVGWGIIQKVLNTWQNNIAVDFTLPSERTPVLNSQEQIKTAFPAKVLKGAAGYYAQTVSRYIETPIEFLFMGYLTVLSAVLSRSVSLKSELNTKPNLYTLLVGESALARKSTVLKKVMEHFKEAIGNVKVKGCWGVGSAEGLQNVLEETNGNNLSPGLILLLDEFKSFVSKCRIENSVLLPLVTTLFESNYYETHTKKRAVKIEDAYISLLAASTLDTYERIYNSAFIDIGFPNRVFLVIGSSERKFPFPKKIPLYEKEAMESGLKMIIQHVDIELNLDITPDAEKVYHEWYINLDKSVHARRLDTYALRLMMLLAANNLKREIDLEVVTDALALCDWQLEIRKEYDPIDADTVSAEMEEAIRRQLRKGPLKDRDLKQKVNANRKGLWIYKTAIKNLREVGEIQFNTSTRLWTLYQFNDE